MVTVRGELHPTRETTRQIVHEIVGRYRATVADHPGKNHFGVAIERGPGPHVPRSDRRGLGSGDVLLLGVAEAPDFIALDALRLDVADRLIVVGGASLAGAA
jgi:hypothetical protein